MTETEWGAGGRQCKGARGVWAHGVSHYVKENAQHWKQTRSKTKLRDAGLYFEEMVLWTREKTPKHTLQEKKVSDLRPAAWWASSLNMFNHAVVNSGWTKTEIFCDENNSALPSNSRANLPLQCSLFRRQVTSDRIFADNAPNKTSKN